MLSQSDKDFRFALLTTIASVLGGRFFLVAMLLAAGGKKLEIKLREYMDRLGWATVALVVIGIGVYKLTSPA